MSLCLYSLQDLDKMNKKNVAYCGLVAVALLLFFLSGKGAFNTLWQNTPKTIEPRNSVETTVHVEAPTGTDPSAARVLNSYEPTFEVRKDEKPPPSARPASVLESESSCTAIIMTADGPREITPNSIGLFPEVTVAPESTTRVELVTDPAEDLTAQVVDGGHLNDLQRVVHLQANQSGMAAFEFISLKSPGTYRIAVDVKGSRQFICLTVK